MPHSHFCKRPTLPLITNKFLLLLKGSIQFARVKVPPTASIQMSSSKIVKLEVLLRRFQSARVFLSIQWNWKFRKSLRGKNLKHWKASSMKFRRKFDYIPQSSKMKANRELSWNQSIKNSNIDCYYSIQAAYWRMISNQLNCWFRCMQYESLVIDRWYSESQNF